MRSTSKDTLRQSLFWDTDVSSLDIEKHSIYIIERILSHGNEGDLRWAEKIYGEDRMKEVLLNSRALDRKSLNFWCLYFNLDPSQCTRKQSINKQSPFWTR
ncbi:MAG: hypothetical protein WDZ70_01445 [Candidatus Paceibacterota bacterium]